MQKIRPKRKTLYTPPLDKNFIPMIFLKEELENEVSENNGDDIGIAVERNDSLISVYKAKVPKRTGENKDMILYYIERIVKTILWLKGGWKITIAGPLYIGEYIKKVYSKSGARKFDVDFMVKVYGKEFTVNTCKFKDLPCENEQANTVGRHLEGCRIGFDAGGSDRKVSAVIDGRAVFSEEVVWHPKTKSNPEYHYEGILDSMKRAAEHMPKVDAIGVSAAGIYINNKVKVASLFIKVPEAEFNEKVENIFFDIQKEMGGVPVEVANDGDVTALAGAMNLDDSCILGIAMGTSEAGGYVNKSGNITGWLNELAFAPVDAHEDAMCDEWSGDIGCGVKYFSQDSVIKLALNAGIKLDENMTPAEKLKEVQKLLNNKDKKAEDIFVSIGCYLGYTLAYYAKFYDIRHVLILGRVTSGRGGELILSYANKVIKKEFPDLGRKIKLHIPDEEERRVGQSIAAASLPQIKDN